MNILFQFPTKGRCEKFFSTLDAYYSSIEYIERVKFHIVIDHFDYSMNNSSTLHKLKSYQNLFVSDIPDKSSKIKACNFNLERFENSFDIVVLISDDMIPQVKNIDTIIEKKMLEHYPNTDGCLWFNDGYTQNRLCTMSIIGQKYFKRFGYIYNPAYTSLWCDNEFTEVAKKLNKITYFEQCIVKHEHPVWNKSVKNDDLYKNNESFYEQDEEVFRSREKINFGLNI